MNLPESRQESINVTAFDLKLTLETKRTDLPEHEAHINQIDSFVLNLKWVERSQLGCTQYR